jgi:lysophospholipase L1-like esterase
MRGVPVVDVRSAFLVSPAWEQKLLLDDGLHLSEQGHQFYARSVQKVLDEEVRHLP